MARKPPSIDGAPPLWLHPFGLGKTSSVDTDISLLGSKGAHLSQMARLGLPVPPGFTLTTALSKTFNENKSELPAGLWAQVDLALNDLCKTTGKRYGCTKNPLLLSVRSGASVSMPGMMDTVLNLGLNDETTKALGKQTENMRFAYDSYRRFIQMYSDVVLEIDHYIFEDLWDDYKLNKAIDRDSDLTSDDLIILVNQYKACVVQETGAPFPTDPIDQLKRAIEAVFKSWHNRRAETYRQLHNIPSSLGTACTIQSMVFGNLGSNSATGVTFTRDPSTGENYPYGEFLVNAQGEDVVAGIRTPQPISEKGRTLFDNQSPSLETLMPSMYTQLCNLMRRLETHYKDMQDIEFTIEQSKLYILQTRSGKRSTPAAIKIAVDMACETLISKEDALLMVPPLQLNHLLHPTLDPKAHRPLIGKGLPASPGAATGQITFDADRAERLKLKGIATILTRIETSPEDVHGMAASVGILTSKGGMTSHAAVVARGMGRPCVCGAGSLRIDLEKRKIITNDAVLSEGDIITIDGSTGDILIGKVPMIQPDLSEDFHTLMSWADEVRHMDVRANAETPRDALQAFLFGAQGIGLCRTEHMFFDLNRIGLMRKMILAETKEERTKALDKIYPAQRDDFVKLLRIVKEKPITIRLLDPPLHEFLPRDEKEIKALASVLHMEEAHLKDRIDALHEFNPMLGHRGCRITITYPEVSEMQARAIFEAMSIVKQDTGIMPQVEIMVPLVCSSEEFLATRAIIDETAQQFDFCAPNKKTQIYKVGSMIELPRAALRANEIANNCDFFSFGSNDLTQSCYGLSRDDAASLLSKYLDKSIFKSDPFQTLDKEGVGVLMDLAIKGGRARDPSLKIGICGEHGGDPASIEFCHELGLDYVSCSPFRVPVAKLSAAQATIKHGKSHND